MRASSEFVRAALALSLAAIVGACGGDEKPAAGLALEIHPAAWDSGEFDPLNTAGPDDIMEIIAARPGQPDAPVFTQVFRLADRRGTLDALPIDDGYRLVVRGFRGPAREFLFYGGTPLFDIVEGKSTRVAIQVGRPDCTMLNHNSSRPSFFVLNGKEDAYFKRWGAASAVLPDGRVLITGGGNVNAEGHLTELRSDIEIYDPRYGQFFFGDESLRLLRPLAHHTATVLADGRVVIFGGLTTENAQPVHARDIQIINVDDPVQKVRTANVAVLPGLERYMHAAARLERDGSVLFTGGIGGDGKPTATVARFFPDPVDPVGGTLSAEGHLQDARVNHAMAPLLREGTLAIVAGGQGVDGEPLKSLEVMVVGGNMTECVAGTTADTVHGCWVPNPYGLALAEPRFGHRALRVGSGHELLFVGGYTARDRTAMAQSLELLHTKLRTEGGEVFSFMGRRPESGELPIGRLTTGRGDFAATPLMDGRILVSGGRQGTLPVTTTSLLSPCRPENGETCTQAFSEVELASECALSQPRFGHEAMRLQNGTVLFVGGVTHLGRETLAAINRAEVFFPMALEACDVFEPCPASVQAAP
ncbi:hypothetical protein L6V77_03055 [Myxococcota bacterium]|jgi:hypothetical protein|nr:hypothetical protein [Myxococcota bacterium]